ncbi:chromosome partitioning protein ParA [Siphonobacter sp. BAB-5385]|uniref:nucleotide-binding protein n=1 Tax=Siphonobacter sp. BAB-5385 TaxID=1864822 RepID=UPI000B9EA339|nr:AAA family ATPase [Siphonobacter sp. BAB-5385]OZI05517.1 chromosome partitioning protein ParA [Siphonobacter sp. BAB-5385]
MIITTGGIKGGCGKTTLATNIAVHLSNLGRDVLFVDADEQGSAYQFNTQREEAKSGATGYTMVRQVDKDVRTEILKLAPKFDDVVIDTGGRDTSSQRAALTVTDIYLVPFFPRSADVWTLGDVEKLVSDMQIVNSKLRAFSVINRADPKSQDNRDAADILKESQIITFLDTPIINRKAFANALGYGLGVTELKPEDEKAKSEFLALYNQIFKSHLEKEKVAR